MATFKEQSEFATELVRIKHRAGQLGLFRTMHALDKATQAVGWELADKAPKTARAKRHEQECIDLGMDPNRLKPKRNKLRERQLRG